MRYDHIPVFVRFQWINDPTVVEILEEWLKPASVGRRGYGKVLLFRWLLYKQCMGCSYRDVESMSGIDYTTFIKFKKQLMKSQWLVRMFRRFCSTVPDIVEESVCAVMDSSFVKTYSKKQEYGSAYSGYKEAHGYKLHSIIDYTTRLPLAQYVTHGAAADVKIGEKMIVNAPKKWDISAFLADKGYDSQDFVWDIYRKWKPDRISIPIRKTNQQKRKAQRQETPLNRQLKAAYRDTDPAFYKKRTEVERYFARKKGVFKLGTERTRGIQAFRTNCHLTSIMEFLEFIASQLLPFFTKLVDMAY